jgi:hypothetical protein
VSALRVLGRRTDESELIVTLGQSPEHLAEAGEARRRTEGTSPVIITGRALGEQLCWSKQWT